MVHFSFFGKKKKKKKEKRGEDRKWTKKRGERAFF